MELRQINPFIIPTLVLAAVAFVAGTWLAERTERTRGRWAVFLAAGLLALPGLLFTLYYLHWLDGFRWLYELRSLPYSELATAASGLLAGMLPSLLRRRRILYLGAQTSVLVLFLCWLSVPYLKMLFGPLAISQLKETVDRGGVCLQSSPSTCGPASAATLAWRAGRFVTERELARESYTTQSGTECWYLARALRARGLSVTYRFTDPAPSRLIPRSIAGVRMGGANGPGHFVAVLGEYLDTWVIGDPAGGKVYLTKSRLNEGEFYFTGFFMQVRGK